MARPRIFTPEQQRLKRLAWAKEDRRKHPARYAAYQLKHRLKVGDAGRAKEAERQHRYYLTHKPQYAAKAHAYYLKHQAEAKARAKAWRLANRDRNNAGRRASYQNDLEYRRAKNREYSQKRRLSGKQQAYVKIYRTENRDYINGLTRSHHQRGIAHLTDSYICGQLKRRYRIPNPTPTQIAHRRGVIAAKRLTKLIGLHAANRVLSGDMSTSIDTRNNHG